jgi:hypothetical protein
MLGGRARPRSTCAGRSSGCGALRNLAPADRVAAAYAEAAAICDDDVETCRAIGEHGLPLMQEIAARKQGPAR